MSSTAYTPELADLFEHEKVIEQGLATFIDVGWALMQIRDGKKYKQAGYSTFEDYCQRRWQMSQPRAYQFMQAAEVAEIVSSTNVEVTPQRESQVRPLAALKNEPEAAAEAWAEAVEEAGGQPTAKQVERAVAKRQPPKKEHPATFSDPILDQVAQHLKEAGQAEATVLDPFAGTGRIHELRDRSFEAKYEQTNDDGETEEVVVTGGINVKTRGIELEPEWAAKHPDTEQGNALELTNTVTPGSVDAIATSPTYGNRMADHHDAKDDSVRLTYKHTLGRDLHEDNSGQMQWGDEYRAFHRKAWAEAAAALKTGGTLTLNIKNHWRAGEQQRVTEWHINTLYDLGMSMVALDIVPTKGLMAGANAEKRTLAEFVITFRKDSE